MDKDKKLVEDCNKNKKLLHEEDFNKLKKYVGAYKPIVILFWADEDYNCKALKTMMDDWVKAGDHIKMNIQFAWTDTDVSDVADALNVDDPQTIAVIHPEASGKKFTLKKNCKAADLQDIVDNIHKNEWFEEEKKKGFKDIDDLIAMHPFYIFAEGPKDAPEGETSKKLMDLIKPLDYSYEWYNVNFDERIKHWAKVYSENRPRKDEPAFPQVFFNQRFIGGIDVIDELIEAQVLEY